MARDLEQEARNKALVLEAFDALFNRRDFEAAERYFSPDYVQHSAGIGRGRDGLFALVRSVHRRYERALAVAEGDDVMVHGRFSGGGRPTRIVVDILRVEGGRLTEHWDVMQDEATRASSKSGLPMFGDGFPDATAANGQRDTLDRKDRPMSSSKTASNTTASTQFVEANGHTYAYRRFGSGSGLPLLLLQHFTGTLDNWDPAVTDPLAAGREVILFDNAGIGRSSGEVPSTVAAMARHPMAFLEALRIERCDVLGYSLGGMVALQMVQDRPSIFRRMILVGTAPRGGEDIMHLEKPSLAKRIQDPTNRGYDVLKKIFFAASPSSQAAGEAFIRRLSQRKDDLDPVSGPKVGSAQIAAFREWEQFKGERFAELRGIRHPALVVNEMIPVSNSYRLGENLPNAVLLTYPDAGHGSLFQYPESFTRHAAAFLTSDAESAAF
jgi:pimeloyl-ACP methyl ester carboxylesterase/predicted SnoaL-like aldol condensation-catalyzing enzyme